VPSGLVPESTWQGAGGFVKNGVPVGVPESPDRGGDVRFI